MDSYHDSMDDQFETSEILASFLASTPLLSDSWRLCSHANAAAPGGFLAKVTGNVSYLAFSGVQEIGGGPEPDPRCGSMVQLNAAGNGLFSALESQGPQEEEEERPVMVHAGFLQLFLGFHGNPDFLKQVSTLQEKSSNCKAIVIAGHSIGAAAAALTSLWLLCRVPSSPVPLLCITFGSPLLGNASLSKAILRERWSGSFCHVASKHDLIPRLLFVPPSANLLSLLQLCRSGGNSIPEQGLFSFVLSCAQKAAEEADQQWKNDGDSCFMPFGTYLFCSEEGGICVDNGPSIVKMMHLLFSGSCPRQSAEDHFKYEEYVETLCHQFLKRRGLQEGRGEEVGLDGSSFDAGVSMALQSSGMDYQEIVSRPARDCFNAAKQIGCTQNLNVAHLAIRLSRVIPNMAQVEWYKASCDRSEERLGYYDTFRQMRTTRREHAVNMSRVSLAAFWNMVIGMWERNELPYDFHRRAKWIYASNTYRLLVEPLDIADYYRLEKHQERGHYVENGRERRYRIFEQWLRGKEAREKRSRTRNTFASLTQDSCFWARVEEAKECVENARNETDPGKLGLVLERISKFEDYVAGLIERKEVSRDVLLAVNSSYNKLVGDWTAVKPRSQQHCGSS